uniref:Uncharacterized protein n=1 Tax=Nelumbo nucifera TaxID=4432 RepID=A0A822Z7I9_NELNU|nr:TPA_asm: hypothetical protein HUJ06_013748 [Nelumbo nucifera]
MGRDIFHQRHLHGYWGDTWSSPSHIPNFWSKTSLELHGCKFWIGSHVDIGANTCTDRGSWRDTVIGDHSKIDNLVQIGHNVVIGKYCILCGQVGIADPVGIQHLHLLLLVSGMGDHATLGGKVRLAANSCVTKDITEPGDYGGFSLVPINEWRRQVATHRWILKGIVDLLPCNISMRSCGSSTDDNVNICVHGYLPEIEGNFHHFRQCFHESMFILQHNL